MQCQIGELGLSSATAALKLLHSPRVPGGTAGGNPIPNHRRHQHLTAKKGSSRPN